MYIYICRCAYTCIYECPQPYTCTDTYTYTYIYIYVTHTYTCMNETSMYVCMHVCMHICMYVCVQHTECFIYIHLHNTCVHICAHTHTHTLTLNQSPEPYTTSEADTLVHKASAARCDSASTLLAGRHLEASRTLNQGFCSEPSTPSP